MCKIKHIFYKKKQFFFIYVIFLIFLNDNHYLLPKCNEKIIFKFVLLNQLFKRYNNLMFKTEKNKNKSILQKCTTTTLLNDALNVYTS